MQAIGCFDGWFVNWVVENNVVITDHWHGISFLGMRDSRIVNNTVIDLVAGQPGPPWIMVNPHKNGTPSSNVIVRNNLATDFDAYGTNVTSDHNVEFTMANAGTYFVAPPFDLHLKPATAAVDTGNPALAPPLDVERVARPQGAGFDLGAYERFVPTLAIGAVSVPEGNFGQANAVLPVTLSGAAGQTVTVSFATAAGTATAGTDYVSASGALTFPPGTTARSVAVPVLGDLMREGNEAFAVNLASPVNATLGAASAQATIVDDDPVPTVTAEGCAVVEGDAGNVPCVGGVRLSNPNSQNVVVDWTTNAGTATPGVDYVATGGVLTFLAGDTQRTASATVLGDTVVEADESFTLAVTAATNATVGSGQAAFVILDDDAPSLAHEELAHGSSRWADLAAAGGVADADFYRIAQQPRSSYEVVVDGASGDVAPDVQARAARRRQRRGPADRDRERHRHQPEPALGEHAREPRHGPAPAGPQRVLRDRLRPRRRLPHPRVRHDVLDPALQQLRDAGHGRRAAEPLGARGERTPELLGRGRRAAAQPSVRACRRAECSRRTRRPCRRSPAGPVRSRSRTTAATATSAARRCRSSPRPGSASTRLSFRGRGRLSVGAGGLMKARWAVGVWLLAASAWAQTAPPPPSRRDDVREVLHGVEIVDPYRWLEDGAAPETRAWIDAQNAYTQSVLSGGKDRTEVHERLAALTRYASRSVPQRRGGKWFFRAMRPTDELSILYVREGDRRRGAARPARPVHRPDRERLGRGRGGRRSLRALRAAPGRRGRDRAACARRGTKQDLPDVLPRALYRGGSLRPDGKGFYYARPGPRDRHPHPLPRAGHAGRTDVEVFGGGYGPGQWISARGLRERPAPAGRPSSTAGRGTRSSCRTSRARRPRAPS